VGLFRRGDHEAYGAASAAFALIAMVFAFGALVAVAQKDTGGDGATGGPTVTLAEFSITPGMITAPLGGSLNVTNSGAAEHNLVVEGTDLRTPDLAAGESASLDLGDLDEGTYTAYCSIAGHRQQGMEAMLHAGSGAAEAMVESGSSGATEEQLLARNDDDDTLMQERTDLYVEQLENGANTEGVGNQPMEPRVLEDGTKVFDITAEVIDWEIEPGKTVTAWAYNGQVPGPWIKVDPGDKVRMIVDNRLPQSTGVHFHGIDVPNAMDGVVTVTQDPIRPGEKFTYEFTAQQNPALGMYHSHHHAENQVPDGLFAVFQVGDVPLPAGMGPITQEVPMVLNDAGVIGLSLNGKSFPSTAPIIAKPGDRVLISYQNEGLTVHPMHLHGVPQRVIAKDGFPLAEPYTVDTLLVSPGERYSVVVEPTAQHLGVWAYHCHILTHAERHDGMFGMVTTFIVQE
jgi:FtsP/CotA-like multicopper oxidase with cupredoxin domain